MKQKPKWDLIVFLLAIYIPCICLAVWGLLTLFPLAGWGVR